ncbi:MAG: prepilin-type N-terminal cleavage/methylation domain-containing protein [Fimbriimonadales bacterium]
MKKAFTLIELLVVIAIIAILAAILFPVFAQAKTAAKKAAAISNQKQIGNGLMMYMADSDDVFPRSDDCIPGSSLNPALKTRPFNPAGVGCTAAPFYNRFNHYAWQKWIYPYVKNIDLFEHPGRKKLDVATSSCPNGQWSDCGQIMGGFALNLALTGALNTYGRSDTALGRIRNSWLGGTQSSLPDVSQAMLTFEIGNPDINFAPVVIDPVNNSLSTQVVYPMAVREFWQANFMKSIGTCVYGNDADPRSTVGNTVTVGFADGSAKALPVGQFLARTPTAAEYGVNLTTNGRCGISSGTYVPGSTPNLSINYPFWGLSQ